MHGPQTSFTCDAPKNLTNIKANVCVCTSVGMYVVDVCLCVCVHELQRSNSQHTALKLHSASAAQKSRRRQGRQKKHYGKKSSEIERKSPLPQSWLTERPTDRPTERMNERASEQATERRSHVCLSARLNAQAAYANNSQKTWLGTCLKIATTNATHTHTHTSTRTCKTNENEMKRNDAGFSSRLNYASNWNSDISKQQHRAAAPTC